jgi:hypothetical protein
MSIGGRLVHLVLARSHYVQHLLVTAVPVSNELIAANHAMKTEV